MKTTSWKEIKDKVYGEKGNARRDALERETAPFKIGLLLKKAREERLLTQEQLAQLVDKKRTYISRVQHDPKNTLRNCRKRPWRKSADSNRFIKNLPYQSAGLLAWYAAI